MAPKKTASTSTVNPKEKAQKIVNRAIKSLFAVGKLEGLQPEHITKIDTFLKSQIDKAITKLKMPPEPKKDEGFTL